MTTTKRPEPFGLERSGLNTKEISDEDWSKRNGIDVWNTRTPTNESPAPQAEVRNWTEDFSHENGEYECKCCKCGHSFIGHKRRVLCKSCSNLLRAPAPQSAPVFKASHNSGERDPSVMLGCAGADTAAPQPPVEGRLPERETFWLIERIGHGQWIKDHGYGPNFALTNDVWHAHRYGTECDAHDRWRYLTAEDRRQYKLTEHIFIHGTAPQPPVEGLRETDVRETLREMTAVLMALRPFPLVIDGIVKGLINKADRALASPSLTAGAWQDISTAPKDGTHIFVCDQSDPSFSFSQRPPTVAHWFGPPDLPGLRSGGWYLSVSYNEQPRLQGLTHWQPLPPAPATLTEQSDR